MFKTLLYFLRALGNSKLSLIGHFFAIFLSLAGTKALAISYLDAQQDLKSAKRIALYVGSFDPMHLGHQTIVENVLARDLADYVIVIPQNLTLHKPKATTYTIRREMIELLYKDHPRVLYPDLSIDLYQVRDGFSDFLSHLSYGSVSITSIILNDLRQINPEAELFNVTGTDILEKAYMRWINGYLFRKFSGHIVSVWTDSAESSSVQLPERVGSVPVIPLEIPGFPRISSSQIKKDFASGTWPSTLDPKLAKPIARYKLYSAAAACEAALKSR